MSKLDTVAVEVHKAGENITLAELQDVYYVIDTGQLVIGLGVSLLTIIALAVGVTAYLHNHVDKKINSAKPDWEKVDDKQDTQITSLRNDLNSLRNELSKHEQLLSPLRKMVDAQTEKIFQAMDNDSHEKKSDGK
ncbi:hypothetical protein [Phaeocystidibacter marisrubri]|uniref:Uncharacterized protein n=1 Tax=Phaeocystidibacter marisrubri TaxID=1577780 RepID=A0A6L3ZFB3_9FLAO|nr:hypothetical protein [Phaeocystidibacter marisrubri]KAB2816107.1 hypothetical protein F8C82_10475 [Phaeocystidibacter marisrubri]